jgi:hypothetical protein
MFLSLLRPSLKIFSSRFLSQTSILPYEIDRFNAVRVRIDDGTDNTDTIRERLSGKYSFVFFLHNIRLIASLQQWQNDQRTSAWLWIPIEKAYLIPIAAELGRERMFDNYEICIDIEGFTYHNAEERTAVLNKWLLPTKSLIPRFATYVKYSFEYE